MANENIQLVISAKDEASAKLSKVKSQVSGLASSPAFGMIAKAAKLASVAVAGVGAAVATAGVFAVKSAAEFEQNRISFETMLGSAEKAKKMLKDVSDFAAKTPFDLPQVVEGSKKLLAYNIEAEKILPTFQALGNIASGVGTDKLPQLVLAFGQVRAATRLTGMELRQFTEAGVPLLTTLAGQLGKTEGQIQEMVSAGEIGFPLVERAIFGMSEEGGKFFNLMDRQSKSFSGILSNMKDEIGRVARQIVGINDQGDIKEGGLFYNLKKGAESLLSWLSNNKTEIAKTIEYWVNIGIEKIRELIRWFQENKNTVRDVAKYIETFGSITFSVIKGIASVVKGLEKAFETFFYSIFRAIDKSKAAWNNFRDAVESAIKKVKDTWNSLKSAMDKVINPKINFDFSVPSSLKKWWDRFKELSGKQFGGAVTSGQPYIVGEHRPEVFVPSQSGNIKQVGEVSGGGNITVNFINPSVRNDSDLQNIIKAVKETLKRDNLLSNAGLKT